MRLPDESGHPESQLEWWFIQGWYNDPGSPDNHFMVSFFRHNGGIAGDPKTEGSSFLVSTLDPKLPEHRTSAWVASHLLDLFLENREEFKALNLDPAVLEILLENVREGRLLSGIEVLPSRAKIRSRPLRIEWESFYLSQNGSAFQVSFLEPRTARKFDLSLRPLVRRIEISPARNVGGKGRGMAYASYPRLALEGTVNGSRVEGTAWMDHQWGNLGWLVQRGSSRRVLGWDWFGINLEDGSDWVIMQHRDAKNKMAISRYAVRRNPSGKTDNFREICLQPARFWRSERTSISHPVEWRIDIGEGFARFRFSALADNQEVPVFGGMRSIWQGAGKVEGIVGGKSVKGQARGEFLGYGYIFNFRDVLLEMRARIDRHIEEFLPRVMDAPAVDSHLGPPQWDYEPAAYTEMLSEPVWDLLSRKGKGWRPIFALHLLQALGTEPGPYEALVGVLSELSHTGALMIDDIEDASSLRRGEECIHLRYGQEVAISAANTLYFLPTLLVFRHPRLNNAQKLEIMEIMMRQYIRAHYGQALDLYWSRNMSPASLQNWLEDSTLPKILQMYHLKTAAPLQGLAETAAVIAGSGKDVRAACLDFAGAVGVAFQIVDDIHCFSTSPGWRKTIGEDLAEGKLTYVIVQALESLKGRDRERLRTIVSSGKMRGDHDVLGEGAKLIRKSKSLQESRLKAKTLVREKWEKLREVIPYSEPLAFIHMLCSYLLNLDYDKKASR